MSELAARHPHRDQAKRFVTLRPAMPMAIHLALLERRTRHQRAPRAILRSALAHPANC
jgi:hypothetical protein